MTEEEKIAKDSGFVNVEAFRQWKVLLNQCTDSEKIKWLIREVCNLKQQVAWLNQGLIHDGQVKVKGEQG